MEPLPMTDPAPESVVHDDGPAGRMYDARLPYRDAERAYINGLTETALHTPEEAAADARKLSNQFASFSFSGDEASRVFSAIRGARTSKPTSEQQAEWAQQAREQVVREFGARNAAQAIRDAKALLAKQRPLHDRIASLGVGNHPAVVTALARKAAAARKSGRLK